MAYGFALHLDVFVGLQILSCWTVSQIQEFKEKGIFCFMFAGGNVL